MQIINWLITHWVDILQAVTAAVISARIIVKLTPTPKDDSLLESFVNAMKHVGLVIKDEPKNDASL